MDLQQDVIYNPDTSPEKLYCSFDTWFEENERWKYTTYHHLYSFKQAQEYYNHS